MNRREFLQQGALAATALAAPQLLARDPAPASRVVDTHTHFYDPTRPEGVPWPKPGTPLYRKVLPADWRAVAEPVGVRETVVVEASERVEDNDWILRLAKDDRSLIGFMGHLRPEKPDFRQHVERLAADPIFRGLRVPQDSVLTNLDGAEFRSGIKLLAEKDLTLDLNGGPKVHAAALAIAAAFPSLRIAIDHVGISGDPTRLSDEWRTSMRSLGKAPNIFCKVSALMEQTTASSKKWGEAPRETAYYRPVLDHCWECFGPQRLIYGSNWPVCEKGGTYAEQFQIVNEYFTGKGKEACEDYFWRNSRTAYRWQERS